LIGFGCVLAWQFVYVSATTQNRQDSKHAIALYYMHTDCSKLFGYSYRTDFNYKTIYAVTT